MCLYSYLLALIISSLFWSITAFIVIHHFHPHRTFQFFSLAEGEFDNGSWKMGQVCLVFYMHVSLTWLDFWCFLLVQLNFISQLREIFVNGLHHLFHLGVPNTFYGEHLSTKPTKAINAHLTLLIPSPEAWCHDLLSEVLERNKKIFTKVGATTQLNWMLPT